MDCGKLALEVDLARRIGVEEEAGAAVGAGGNSPEEERGPGSEEEGFEGE